MEDDTLINNAIESIKGFCYQFYIALDKCFELSKGETLYLEIYGDVSILGKEQIEVKEYKDPLTDTHDAFWKTLKNWLDLTFDIDLFKELILLTTQDIGKQSLLIGWNDKNKCQKIEALEKIRNKYIKKAKKDKQTIELLDKVLDSSNRNKLLKILEKFYIVYSQHNGKALYDRIKDKNCKAIELEDDKELFVDRLLGYIISPKILKSKYFWNITYDDFSKQVGDITSLIHNRTKVFPQKINLTEINASEYHDHLFVKKIEDIEYEEVIKDAIDDYIFANNLMLEYFKQRYMFKADISDYKNGILKSYRRMRSRSIRNSVGNDVILTSQNFYDDIMTMPHDQLLFYTNTPKEFRNGLVQNLADSDNVTIKWKLIDE